MCNFSRTSVHTNVTMTSAGVQRHLRKIPRNAPIHSKNMENITGSTGVGIHRYSRPNHGGND